MRWIARAPETKALAALTPQGELPPFVGFYALQTILTLISLARYTGDPAPLAEYVPTANGLIEPVSAPYVMRCGKTFDGVYQRQPGTLLEAPINLDPDEGDAGNPINLDPEEGEMVENPIIL
ncbi:hypothetical protein ETB97_002774 [Aspergillus alliaceus]|uniref:Uncharacterized protein n=1 Tax=Petromyces alliaceus TaxID=209559 RepID=A0A8H6E5T4_PETAA|nr:hypothetical protein ETB97_002774 [Aspergillus burnettii]